MPRLYDTAQIREILEADRPWSVYMLADLEPPYSAFCEWYAAGGALLLKYRGFGRPVIVAAGDASLLPNLIAEAGRPDHAYVALRPESARALARAGYELSGEHSMIRMLLDPAAFAPVPLAGAVRLRETDSAALALLYADGKPSGEQPPFYDPAMLSSGVYHGLFEEGVLAGAAGTHVFAPPEAVACIGNVYTRRDRRGRGIAAGLTSVLVSDLLASGLRTIALNVDERNTAARGIYRRLGFFEYCRFVEAAARRTG
jgi:ribosomal protein S18 acetylase RimI-like enzyme